MHTTYMPEVVAAKVVVTLRPAGFRVVDSGLVLITEISIF
jgi:hypothetical protein